MADLARKTASIYINHDAAEQALVALQKQADKLSTSIKKGQDAGKDMVKELAKLNDTKNQIAAVQRQIDQGLKPSFNQLQTLVAKTRAELKKMSESDPGFAKKAKDLNKYSTELSRLGQQIGAVKKESGGIKDMLGEALPVLGWAAAGAAAVGFFKSAIDEALEADKITGQFINTLDKAGRSDAFARLSDSADAMAAKFKFLDNDDIVNVFDKLITYGKLTEAQITKLTPVIINFAAKSKTSLDTAATTIIKALSGSGRELEEYGVKITRTQTDSERLSLIMNDLAKKVEGAGEAFGETTQGNIANTQQNIKDLKEEIGTGLLPVIQKALQGINSLVDGIKWAFFSAHKSIQDLEKELTEKNSGRFAEEIATEMGQKTIEEQKKLAESYKSIYIASQKALSDFLNSSNKENIAERDRLLANQEQDEKIYLASQRTLQDSIDTARKNKEAEDKANADANAKKAEEARKKALQEYQQSLQRADGFRKQALDAIAKANISEIQLLKDKYKNEADDQTKSFAERLAAVTSYNAAGLKLIAQTTADQQTALDNEIATDKKNAKSKEELAAIEQLRIAKQADIEKQNALSLSNFKIEVAQKYTDVTKQEYKKQTDEIEKEFGKQKDLADQAAKDQVNALAIETDSKLLDLDKAFQDGKIKNLKDYQKQRDQILFEGQQKELKQQLQSLEIMQSYLAAYGVKNSDIDKKIADLKVAINKNANENIGKDDETALQKKLDFANAVMSGAQQIADIIGTMNDAKNAQDEAEIANNQKQLDADTAKLDRELAKKIISQKEYDRQLKALQDKKAKQDAALKKKEFERNKEAQLTDAIMGGANAIISALKAPWPLDFIMAGLASAMVVAQIAKITSAKAPQYAKGGVLDGPTHAAGGMPVYSRGRKVAEVEGGEAILSRKTVANNRALVNELLRASMYGNGGRITPYYQNRSEYRPINYSGINRSIERVRYFEKGGIMPTATGSTSTTENNLIQSQILSTLNNINESVQDSNAVHYAVMQKLSEPIKSYTLLSDANAAQETYDRIKKETTITR